MADYTKGAAYIDGQLVPIAEAKISLLDWGFLHSDATYDVVHVWDGKFFRLNDHLQRFYSGMDKLRMSIPYSPEQVQEIISDCVKATGLRESYVEIITTRGTPQPGSRDPRLCTNKFFAFAIPFVWITQPDQGLHLVISETQRIPAASVDPVVKNYHWLDLVKGQFEAYDKGGETAALVDAEGNIMEGPGFNIFAIKGGVITTPANGVLQGVTRKTAIQLAYESGYEMIEGTLTASLLGSADEVFATSTAGGIMPISKIDGKDVGNGGIGPITKTLQNAYWALHEHPDYSIDIDYSS